VEGSLRHAPPCDPVTDDQDTFDPLKRAWATAYDAAKDGYRWAPIMVRTSLQEAHRTVGLVAGPVRPKREGSAMPAYTKDEIEIWFERMAAAEQLEADAAAQNYVRPTATREQVAEMERVIEWQRLYLAPMPTQLRPHPLDVLNVWLRCPDRRNPFSRACKALGWKKMTAKRRVNQALWVIAAGLMRDLEPVPARFLVVEPAPEPAPRPPAAVVELPALPAWFAEVELQAMLCGIRAGHTALWYAVNQEFEGIPASRFDRDLRFRRLKRILDKQMGEPR
jgi:hypothetical protein